MIVSESQAVAALPAPTLSRSGLNFVAIDFETAAYRRDSACAIGLVKVVEGAIVADFPAGLSR